MKILSAHYAENFLMFHSPVSETSLNDILTKRTNNMNKFVSIVFHWSIHRVEFHSYIKKMYNSVKLREEDWCLQRYIWQKDLDPMKLHKEEVIEILIYGIKSSRH